MPPGEWESYFWPGTQVLRNRYGVRNESELARREYASTARRQRELSRGDARVEATFDAAHLQGLHRHLFQDVFDWAGQFRTVDIAKDGRGFAPTRLIDHYLAEARDAVTGVDWPGVDRVGFARGMAAVYAPLNQAHPFREGNGRTGRVFLDAVAEASPFRLDYSRVKPVVWNQRSAFSGPDLGYLAVHPDWLVPVFEQMTIERPPTVSTGPGERPSADALEALRVARIGRAGPARVASYGPRQPPDPESYRRRQQQPGPSRGEGYGR
ncbi:Fic family protein [uncultured Pseudokineococcus sp.]|uniref:Fic/DOC family protein n=1 Tax=uncultured Pseudokineococcus sp. TaxID=1642928 RepID=UPI00262C11C0|nr:Fic family protein [uncultured Pseudokineococcus sp.]